MIILQKLNEHLEELQIPIIYHHFKEEIAPPFLVFYEDGEDVFFADNKTFYKNNNIVIELYTNKKDVYLENKLANLFEKYEYIFHKQGEIWIEKENLYQLYYQINK